jgi:plastocyanin
MRRKLAIAISAVAATALLTVSLASGATETVEVGDDFFAPKKVKIEKNDRVKFNWTGTNEHDVVRLSGPGKYFESGPMTGTGVLFKQKFKEEGTYKLICSLHDEMDLTVKVKDPKKGNNR